MKKFNSTIIFTIIILAIFSCKKNSTEPKLDQQTDAVGTWLVTRTLVTPNQDFTNGYADQQTWTIAVSGETATLSTSAGTINGTGVQSTTTYAYPH